jgi:hypothetical protein
VNPSPVSAASNSSAVTCRGFRRIASIRLSRFVTTPDDIAFDITREEVSGLLNRVGSRRRVLSGLVSKLQVIRAVAQRDFAQVVDVHTRRDGLEMSSVFSRLWR